MGVASWLLILLGLLMGLGQSGVLALAEGWVTVLSCTVVWGGWLPGAWRRKHACCGGCPLLLGVACCRGSGAVRPGCLTYLGLLVVGGFGWVWVGWL